MAGPLTWVSTAGTVNLEYFTDGDIWRVPRREIVNGEDNNKTLRAQVVVDEDHDDELVITEHPISGGSVIHDHAFKRPAEVRVRMGWSNAYLSDIGVSSVKELYEQILALQVSRIPCKVYTGKREYENMLVASCRTHTDASMEFSIIADISFREIVLTSTSSWAIGLQTYNQGPLSQAQPEATTYTTQGGTIQLIQQNIQQNSIPAGTFDPIDGTNMPPLLPHIAPLPDHPTDPEQAVFHPPANHVLGPRNFFTRT